jgi:hypothetical protein
MPARKIRRTSLQPTKLTLNRSLARKSFRRMTEMMNFGKGRVK